MMVLNFMWNWVWLGKKRNAEVGVEQLDVKKQKKEVETAVQNAKKDKKTKTIIVAAVNKKVESSSSDDSSSESEQVSCVFLCINRTWNTF